FPFDGLVFGFRSVLRFSLYARHPQPVNGYLKKSSSTPTRKDFLLRNTAPFLPFVPIADHSCSGLSSCAAGRMNALNSTRFYRPESFRDENEKHPQPLPIKNGSIRRSRFTTPLASDPTKPANPQPTEAISRPAK